MVNIYTNGSSGFAAFFPVFKLPANDDVDGDDDEGVAGGVAQRVGLLLFVGYIGIFAVGFWHFSVYSAEVRYLFRTPSVSLSFALFITWVWPYWQQVEQK